MEFTRVFLGNLEPGLQKNGLDKCLAQQSMPVSFSKVVNRGDGFDTDYAFLGFVDEHSYETIFKYAGVKLDICAEGRGLIVKRGNNSKPMTVPPPPARRLILLGKVPAPSSAPKPTTYNLSHLPAPKAGPKMPGPKVAEGDDIWKDHLKACLKSCAEEEKFQKYVRGDAESR
jgi:hypothetical protein